MDFAVISSFCMVFVMASLLVILVLIPKPRGKEWKTFRMALSYFELACFVLLVANLRVGLNPEQGGEEVRSAITLGVSYFQALLFTALPVVMLDGKSRFISSTIYQVIGLAFMSVVMVITSIVSPDGLYPCVFRLNIAAYLLLCIAYSLIFVKIYSRRIHQLEEFYDDDMRLRTHWMLYMFCVALAIGLMAPIGAISENFYTYFKLMAAVLYAYLLACLLRYIMTGQYMFRLDSDDMAETALPQVNVTSTDSGANNGQPGSDQDTGIIDGKYRKLESLLTDWIAGRKYIQTDIGVEEIAHELGTSYVVLCRYFSDVKGTTFRNWRTLLRIEESKKIMKEHPDMGISEIAEMSGFNDRANFYRSFKKAEGMTPSDYRERIKGV